MLEDEDEARFDLNNDGTLPAIVEGLQVSKNSAIVNYQATNNEPRTEVFELPEKLRNVPYFKLLISYMQSARFKQLTGSTKGVYLYEFKRLKSFAEAIRSSEILATNIALLKSDYLRHIKKQGRDPYVAFIAVRQPMTWAKGKSIKEGSTINGWNKVTQAMEITLPKLQKPKYKPFKSLSQSALANNDQTDEEYLVSLRSLMLWLLSEWQAARKMLLSKSTMLNEYIECLDNEKYEQQPMYELPRGTGINERKYGESFTRSEKLYGEMFRLAIEEKNEFLIELFFYSQRNNLEDYYSGKRFLLDEMIVGLESMRSQKNSQLMRNYAWWVDGKKCIRTKISTFSLSHLVHASKPEMFAISYLLASDRIQLSGIRRLKLDQIYIDSKKLQITNFLKFRGSKNNKFDSVIYRSNSSHYKVIKEWVELIKSGNKAFHSSRKGYVLPVRDLVSHTFGGCTNNEFLGFDLIGMEGSLLNLRCKEEVEKSDPMLSLFEKTINYNFKAKKRSLLENENKKNIDVSGKLESWGIGKDTLINRVTISTNEIAMSRVWVDEGRDPKQHAKSKAHSEATNKNIYKDRSTVKEVFNVADNFAAQVGDLMESDARKINCMVSNCDILSLEDARKKLGIASPLEQVSNEEALQKIYQEAEIKEYFTDIIGELTKDEEHFVIATPLSACLILGYIKHIDNEMERLICDNPGKGKKFLIKKAYLLALLDRMPKAYQVEGKKMLSKYKNIPYPSLV
jgi:hypothetical protein